MTDIWPIRFDAKKCAYRQSKDGMVLSLVIHPSADCVAVIAAAEIGFDFQVALEPSKAGAPTATATVRHRRELTEGERAVQRSGILRNDNNFREWVTGKIGWKDDALASPEDAAEYIRHRCRIPSCRELATKPDARSLFWLMVDQYEKEMGLRAEER